MKCTSGNPGQFLCVNKYCKLTNAFICSDPKDKCKDQHESCSLLNLSYVIKKLQTKANTNKYQTLAPIYDKCVSLVNLISAFLSIATISIDIDKILTSGKPISKDDKEKIAKFTGEKKLGLNNQEASQKIEKQLEDLQFLIASFGLDMKERREKEIDQLKRLLSQEEKFRQSLQSESPRYSKLAKTSRIERQPVKAKSHIEIEPRKKKPKLQISPKTTKSKIEFEDQRAKSRLQIGSIIKNSRKRDSEKVSPKQKSKEKSKSPEKPKSKVSFSPQKDNEQIKKSTFTQKILRTTLKNHVPKTPLFSKITNDIKSINIFFKNKFESARLLYRASQNQYLVSRFHDKCDGHRHTLTLVLTEFDKVIGGYTPLSWRTGSGEWYEDQKGKSFLFNLSLGQKYPLIAKQKAIWCSKGFGPSFGHPDLEIADKAFYNTNSCANFPSCYNNGSYKSNSSSIQAFCGTKSGHFRIKQWQVYEITFS